MYRIVVGTTFVRFIARDPFRKAPSQESRPINRATDAIMQINKLIVTTQPP